MRPPCLSSLSSLFLALLLFCGIVLTSTLPKREASFPSIERLDARSYLRRSPLLKRAPNPPVPTVAQCKARLTVPKDKAVFYSSRVMDSAKAWASDNGGVTIWSAGLTDFAAEIQQQCQDVANSNQDSWGLAENDQFFINASKAFAQLASGAVTAILPGGSDGKTYLPKGSFFTLYEWDILKDSSQNAGVTKVTGIVGNEGEGGSAPSGAGTTIWPCE